MNNNKPKLSFLVCGSGKAGTTWLHACCEEHPEICVPIRNKELHFFSKYYDKGFNWYNAYFNHYKNEKAIGELCPTYFYTDNYSNVAQRIYKSYPEVKIVLILRHPVEKAYSDYRMLLRAGKVSSEIESVIVPGWDHVETARYYYHLCSYLKFFPKNNIHILLYDDLVKDPKTFLMNFFKILNVDKDFTPKLINKKYHVTKDRPKYQNLYNKLVYLGEQISSSSLLGRKIIELIRKKGIVDIFHKLNKGEEFPLISQKQRESLIKYFEDDIKNIEKFTGENLDIWKK